jgi:riboflavin-specific deaminase-like protein
VKPFIFVNVAMTADGKIAPASRRFQPFAGARDKEHLLELRATADAVMAGARTVDLDKVNLGPGPERYRRQRVRRGLAACNLRVIVSGSGSINPRAEVFKHRFSPIIVLTTGRAKKSALSRLRGLADEVKICGQTEIDFGEAAEWLRAKWKVKRLLCEGGGEVNGALFAADLVDEIHLTMAPIIFGGRNSPTMADGAGVLRLADAKRYKMISMKQVDRVLFLIYRRNSLLRR